jgi:hypothetical protein
MDRVCRIGGGFGGGSGGGSSAGTDEVFEAVLSKRSESMLSSESLFSSGVEAERGSLLILLLE